MDDHDEFKAPAVDRRSRSKEVPSEIAVRLSPEELLRLAVLDADRTEVTAADCARVRRMVRNKTLGFRGVWECPPAWERWKDMFHLDLIALISLSLDVEPTSDLREWHSNEARFDEAETLAMARTGGLDLDALGLHRRRRAGRVGLVEPDEFHRRMAIAMNWFHGAQLDHVTDETCTVSSFRRMADQLGWTLPVEFPGRGPEEDIDAQVGFLSNKVTHAIVCEARKRYPLNGPIATRCTKRELAEHMQDAYDLSEAEAGIAASALLAEKGRRFTGRPPKG